MNTSVEQQNESESLEINSLDFEMHIRATAASDPLFAESLKIDPAKAIKEFLGKNVPMGIEIVPLEQLGEGKLYVILPPSKEFVGSLESLKVGPMKGMAVAGCTTKACPGSTCEITQTCGTFCTCQGYPC